jgi:hypothetical protein
MFTRPGKQCYVKTFLPQEKKHRSTGATSPTSMLAPDTTYQLLHKSNSSQIISSKKYFITNQLIYILYIVYIYTNTIIVYLFGHHHIYDVEIRMANTIEVPKFENFPRRLGQRRLGPVVLCLGWIETNKHHWRILGADRYVCWFMLFYKTTKKS